MQILFSNITLFVHIARTYKKLFCIYNLVNANTYNQYIKVAYKVATYYIYNILLLKLKLFIFKYLRNFECPHIQTFNTFFNR